MAATSTLTAITITSKGRKSLPVHFVSPVMSLSSLSGVIAGIKFTVLLAAVGSIVETESHDDGVLPVFIVEGSLF